MKVSYLRALSLMAVLAAGPGSERAHAGVVQCSVSTDEVSFGTFVEIDGNVRDTVSRLRVTCTGTKGAEVKYTISLTGGSGPSAARTMNRGKNALLYNLYSDRTHRQIWGDGNNGTAIVTDTMVLDSSSCHRDYTIYGRISSARTEGPFEYAETTYGDTVYVLVSY
jgi:spore coat protein U-like protein